MTRPEQYSPYDASDPATPPEELAHIAEHRPDLRALVAGNPATPPDVLDRLGRLGDLAVDAALRRRGEGGGFAAPSAVPPPGGPYGVPGAAGSPYAVPGAAGGPYAVPGAAGGPYATAGAGYGSPAPWVSGAEESGGSGAVKWIIAGAVVVIAVVAVVVGLLFSGGAADPAADVTASEEAGPDAVAYGDDAYLDGLWDACETGDAQACDDLFTESPFDSEYEAFGASCGGRFEGTEEWCTDLM